MKKDRPGVSFDELRWHPARGISAPILVADNKDLVAGGITPLKLPTVAVAGYGVKRRGLERMLRGFAQAGHHVVAVDLPFTDKALRGRRDLVIQVAGEGPHEVADELRRNYKVSGPIDVLGHSKGASVAGRAMRVNHAGIRNAALVQSPELSRLVELDVTEAEERPLLRRFVGDIVASTFNQEINLAETRAGGVVLATFVSDLLTHQFQVIAGPVVKGSQVEPVFSHVQAGKTVLVTATGRDKVFPPMETFDTLTTAARAATDSGDQVQDGGRLLYYLEPYIPHLNGDAPQGMRLLTTALDRLADPESSAQQAIQIYPMLDIFGR